MKKLTTSRLITLYLDPSSASKLTLEDWSSALLILRKAKMLARYAIRLRDTSNLSSLPNGVQRHFNNALTMAQRQAAQTVFEARAFQDIVSTIGVRPVFLKGAGYTLSNCGAATGRIYSDIDILVSKENIEQVEKMLAIHGWLHQEISDYDEQYYRNWAHEIPPLVHGERGTILDVHHNLVPIVSGKSLNMDALMQSCLCSVGEVDVFTPAGQFFHSAIHLFFNDDVSSAYRDLNDLYLLIQFHEQSIGDELPKLVEQFGFEREIHLALHYLNKWYDYPVPDKLLSTYDKYQITGVEHFIFNIVTQPIHEAIDCKYQNLALWLAQVRGHLLKMPIKTLIGHTCQKLWRASLESVFGKHYFTPDEQTKLHR